MGCSGECKRLYKASRKKGESLYNTNRYCGNCCRFINFEGIKFGKSNWRCRCCNYPVRHTPITGRKSLKINKDLNNPTLLEYKHEPIKIKT